MKLFQVAFQHRRCISGWIAGYEDGEERSSAGGRVDEGESADAILRGGGNEVDHVGHFVKFFGTDVGAVGEAEIDLEPKAVSVPF